VALAEGLQNALWALGGVPWTPSLERHLSHEVLGIARVGRIEWTFARSRGLGIG